MMIAKTALKPFLYLERVMGIEPTSSSWKEEILPLNHTRIGASRFELELNPPKGLVLPLHHAPV